MGTIRKPDPILCKEPVDQIMDEYLALKCDEDGMVIPSLRKRAAELCAIIRERDRLYEDSKWEGVRGTTDYDWRQF